MLATSLVFSSLLPLPSTVLSPTNSHVLNTVRHVKSIKNFHVTTAYHDLVEKISTDVIHPNVSDDHGLLLQVVLAVHGVVYNQLTCADCLQKCWKYEKTHMSTTITTEYHSLVNENFNLCDTSYVRYLPGLLLLVVLAVHSAVDHETTWAKIRQVGYPWKGLSKNILVLQSSCLWVRWGGKEPNLQNLPLAAFYHFGASWKAVIARSLTFEQRQIEGWSWWQNWPISCALQLCCWVGDLKTNSLGSRPASMKM